MILPLLALALSSETLLDWRNPNQPQISPDGQRIVYTLETADRFNDRFENTLWMVSVDGKDHRPIGAGRLARWSPDGTKLAYLKQSQLWVRWMDTGVEARITDLETPPTAMSWSPDGTQLAFLRRVAGTPEWSIKMPKAPEGAKWAEPPSVVTRLRWRADGIGGAGLIPNGFTHLFVVPVTGGAPRRISSGDFNHGGEPSWTPDGKTIYLHGARSGNADHELYPDDVWAFDVASGKATQITKGNGPDQNPLVSPDGKFIAWLGHPDKGNATHTTSLWLAYLDGSNARRLAQGLDRNLSTPAWGADGKTIYAVVEDAGTSAVYSFGLDGNYKALTDGKLRLATAYAAAEQMTIARNGQVAITGSSPQQPKEVFTFAVAGGAPKKLTDTNGSLLAAHPIGAVEEIRYKSFDGKMMQGWIIKPPGFDPARKYPLILDIHGGPHAMYGIEFNHQMQIYAARGFVVLYTNPRGSTGYGEEFANVIHGSYPGDDYQDLMAGVDAVIAKGYIDPKKLCVTGGSGGGILTAWIVTRTDRFAAAVSQYPVINWFTQTGSADIGLTMTRWMKAMPWENPKQYIDHSPLFFADKVKTPTMLITGEEDWRTPIGQTEEFYFALKARKIDTVMVRIPREPHGIRGAFPSHRIAKVEHILGWFEKYVK
jgi:dipeptidyl aminopeptidase/acylaminoacyl peptidase